MRVLLTGATGYVGSRLLRRLEGSGVSVRCLTRRPAFLLPGVSPSTEVFTGDVLDRAQLEGALRGIDTAYYLLHSMHEGGDFREKEKAAALGFAAAARGAGLRKIIYLGGLGDDRRELSDHLQSRHEVGRLLHTTGVPVIELRASIIIGSGSLSFELIRALVERLPVMITPRWVRVTAQPIAVDDVMEYLEAALRLERLGHAVFEIGGAEPIAYAGLMQEYARLRGLRRWMIPVPVLTPRLSSLWLGFVTPVYARVGRILIDSIRHETVVRDTAALQAFPVRPMSVRHAIARALETEDREFGQVRWADNAALARARRDWGGVRFGSRLVDSRELAVTAPPEKVFAAVEGIGGSRGWYHADWLWRVRGWLDLLVGGVGMRRGRRDPHRLRVGDVVDCWRVERIDPPQRLRLAAEMRLPGRAWLDFEVRPEGSGCALRQTATFDPVGLTGLAYWYALYPLHEYVFRGMLRGIARAGST